MIKAVIADDEQAVVSIINYFIDRKNLPIGIEGVATDGRSALNIIDKINPDIVFLDIMMPALNGFEVMLNAPDKKYIIITAYESFAFAQRSLRLGACDIILKPIDYEQFIHAVTRAVGWQFTDNQTVNNVVKYIHDNYNEKIELSVLSKMFYITPSHLSRLFKKHLGTSVLNYIHKVRISNAQRMLEEGKYDIKQIAEMTGYTSLNNFYKYFSFYTGDTPGKYTKNANKETLILH